MKAFIITMMDNEQSVTSTTKLLQSIKTSNAEVQAFIMPATVPETIDHDIKNFFSGEYAKHLYDLKGNLQYTWPKTSVEDAVDFSTGLYKRAYAAADWRKVAACTISHMRLWQHCIDINQTILILEHDALFVNGMEFKQWKVDSTTADGIVGINNPIGTTRKASIYLGKVEAACNRKGPTVVPVPYVDGPGDPPLPSGLAGNSAYVIKPWAAKKLLDKTAEIGIWPNDALMCKQFFPWLRQSYPFYTQVQGTKSTTTT